VGSSLAQKDILERLLEGRRKLLATAPAKITGRAFLLEHARLVDEAVRGIYELAASEAREASTKARPARDDGRRRKAGREREEGTGQARLPIGDEVAIVATGGYGRHELSPFSDIDIAFVPAEEDHPFADRLIRKAFQLVVEIFLDKTDLHVGYAFRPVSDVPLLDHKTKTALLDARVVAGSEEIGKLLRSGLMRHLDVAGFLRENVLERHAARSRAQASLHCLEPNVKEGPGGLRDFQAAVWMARVRNGIGGADSADVRGGERGALAELVTVGLVEREEADRLEAALEFIWTLRNWLHLTAKRKQDIFAREYHERAARELGAPSTEGFLEMYYCHAEVVHRFSNRVAEALLESRLDLGDGFWAEGGKIFAREADIEARPQILLRPFQLMQQYGFEPSLPLAECVERMAGRLDEEARRSPLAASAFLSALSSGADAGRLLREMYELGVLERYLPELGRVMRLVPRESGHTLTVGEHCIVVAEYLSSLADPDTEKASQLADAMAQVLDREALLVAGLLHDAGKGLADKDHSDAGAELARQAALRMGFDAERSERVGKLVREHLTLPRTSRLRDTRDPLTIRDVAEVVGDPETLHMLYLLAWADGRAVDQRAFGGPEARRFDELYFRALAAMTAREGPLSVERMRARLRTQLVATC
jgi:[protein-PII] uridylyltransferase